MPTQRFEIGVTTPDTSAQLAELVDFIHPKDLADALASTLRGWGVYQADVSVSKSEPATEREEDAEPARPEPLTGNRIGPDGRKRTLGPIDNVHRVGEYMIVEFRWDASGGPKREWHRHGRTYFEPYIDNKSTCVIYGSLDSALIGAIGYKREGPNGRAAGYFERMTMNLNAD